MSEENSLGFPIDDSLLRGIDFQDGTSSRPSRQLFANLGLTGDVHSWAKEQNRGVPHDLSITEKEIIHGGAPWVLFTEASKEWWHLRNNDYGIAKTQLSKELNMHTTTISKYLKVLEQFGIIFKKKI